MRLSWSGLPPSLRALRSRLGTRYQGSGVVCTVSQQHALDALVVLRAMRLQHAGLLCGSDVPHSCGSIGEISYNEGQDRSWVHIQLEGVELRPICTDQQPMQLLLMWSQDCPVRDILGLACT